MAGTPRQQRMMNTTAPGRNRVPYSHANLEEVVGEEVPQEFQGGGGAVREGGPQQAVAEHPEWRGTRNPGEEAELVRCASG